ncbi:hypothetical protein K5E_22090 [Enterococcus thailandicus]|uniref:hypothetical protein n=1 Tax=Enterococcus thailandicus TaxID=417368 RepID=UPI00244D8F4D|nr:hypothetical protein [Enterococcus thailandicus]GMC02544.1 hypothetical protein K4E_00540 [Enterococcus thailandicus]GMC10070.1 hypothetical protein K5E_22090 [Enterococcus thailandicus]
MTKEGERHEKILYLTIGKEVKLKFDEQENLSSIRLSVNKVAELFGNELLTEESIFEVSLIGLITKSNFKTYIRIVGGKQIISGDTKYEKVSINQKKTRDKKGNKNVYQQGFFEFFVSNEEKVSKKKLILPRNV